ncbi:class I SAM-dependent methyltransferase [Pelagicoccus enzymogenes]|uniref:class I SAM-dependent methyltransferase n=1 Tax=Pelagicoccus enzymogenes TaxID=2773457 RepID=UPI00280FCBD4|nr:class I SAM-dependent methyltransferase [Pelagicoccus enzymogenes]MDQ8199149.1 class I SAM-dependent methyltransferase [Pelagicoccus enzymogenes]
MSKAGEKDYLRKLGEAGQRHAFDKPFSDPHCGMYLIHLGNIMGLLPPAPARILDLGVGTGWTSAFLSRAGYEVVGVDISDDMIALARRNAERYEAVSLDFVVSDYETLRFSEEFDAAVFYDSLHHAIDEKEALACAFRALKVGGVLVCHEPAQGHADAVESVKAREQYGITERDMPPQRIVEVGTTVGFSSHELYSHSWKPVRVGPLIGASAVCSRYWERLMSFFGAGSEAKKDYFGRNMVVLRK